MTTIIRLILAAALLTAFGCAPAPTPESDATDNEPAVSDGETIEDRLAKYTEFTLTTDLSELSDAERQMISVLIEAAREMDAVFWQQAYGDRDELLAGIEDEAVARFVEINYGPWDRLAGDEPFVDGVDAKPKGANFYPADVTKEEVEAAATDHPALLDLYTLVRRDDNGDLSAVPYHEAYAEHHQRASELLTRAAALAEDEGLKRYLELRAQALLDDDYLASDMAWMDMKTNGIDVVIGPIEVYEDQLFGNKAGHEAYVLVKDRAWSDRLSRYAALLPRLQENLPVPEAYRSETPGSDADLNAYDAVYYAGHSNAGSKTIAINLPNDERVQLEKGTRRLQLKNAMRAKFDKILVPIADVLLDADQRQHITFDAFFENTMFHEVAHGLGIKNLVSGEGTVREALAEHGSAIEEGKADVLGLYMVTQLAEWGELEDPGLTDNYITFMTSIFRSIRFGSSSAHGIANLIRFNYFLELGAFSRDDATGTYRVDEAGLLAAANSLSERILRLQGDGDYQAVADFVATYGRRGEQLEADLARLTEAGIPVDIVFEQGETVLGLEP
ncbi:MAG: Zn-dependent hydrolase [Acidobacteriota bacterium]